MQEKEIHLFPRDISLKKLAEFLFPNIKTLDPQILGLFHRQATSSLMLVMLMVLGLSAFIFIISLFSDIDTFVLAKSLILLVAFFIIILAVHRILNHKKLDYYLLLSTVIFVASWGVTKDIINFGIVFNSYGILYVTILFFGLIFMPFAPKASLFLGAYCAVFYSVLWLLFVERIFGAGWISYFSNLFGVEWIAALPDKATAFMIMPHFKFFIAWRIVEYLSFGLIAFVFRAANIRSYVKTFTATRELVDRETELNAIKALMARSEGQRIEFKSSVRWDFVNRRANKALETVVIKSLAGFFNSGGGILFIGVADNGDIIGLENDYSTLKKSNSDGFESFVMQLVSENMGKEICGNLRVSFHKIEEKEICSITVEPSQKPVFIEKQDGAFFIRTGNNTQQLNPKETLEYISTHFH